MVLLYWKRAVASDGVGLQGAGFRTILRVRQDLVDLLKEFSEPARV